MAVLDDAGRAVGQTLLMAWQAGWALVLGFLVAGAVRVRASTGGLRARLATRRPSTVARATALGAVSSSCSYAAASVTRALVDGGADVVVAVVFMVASTNLVLELGLAVLALLGWQLLVAQSAGALVLIAVLATLGGGVLVRAWRTPPGASAVGAGGTCHGHEPGHEGASWPRWLRTVELATDEVRMLRRELVLGFVAAGTLAALVPAHAWATLFLHGRGGWTALENAAIAPLVALLSCVCSVGNVPLAAVLWRGGIGFGGTVAFLLSDLLALPLLLVYRRSFGGRVALALAGVLYMSIVLASLIVGAGAHAIGTVPRPGAAHPLHLWDPTTALDVVAAATVGVLWCARQRRRHEERAAPQTTGTEAVALDAHG